MNNFASEKWQIGGVFRFKIYFQSCFSKAIFVILNLQDDLSSPSPFYYCEKRTLLSDSKSYHWVLVFRNLKTPPVEVRQLCSSIYRIYNEPLSCKVSRKVEQKVGEENRGEENSGFPSSLCLICLVNSQPSVEAIASKTYSRRHVLENYYWNSWNPSSLEPFLDSTYIYIWREIDIRFSRKSCYVKIISSSWKASCWGRR